MSPLVGADAIGTPGGGSRDALAAVLAWRVNDLTAPACYGVGEGEPQHLAAT